MKMEATRKALRLSELEACINMVTKYPIHSLDKWLRERLA